MGCDVHPVVLRQGPKLRSWWEAAYIPDHERYYDWFGLLADVRGESPVGKTLGLIGAPPDVPTWSYEKFISDEHTLSWFSLRRAQEFYRRHSKDLDEGLLKQFHLWLAPMEFVAGLYGLTPDEVICVFDFDN
jgi:hypothetical protein